MEFLQRLIDRHVSADIVLFNLPQRLSVQPKKVAKIKDTITSDILRPGGIVICIGHNSNGFGLKRGFQMVQLFLVNHATPGVMDTIMTAEVKL